MGTALTRAWIKCTGCDDRPHCTQFITWSQQKLSYGAMVVRGGLDRDEVKRIGPQCQKCAESRIRRIVDARVGEGGG
jgi:hypothetical protein